MASDTTYATISFTPNARAAFDRIVGMSGLSPEQVIIRSLTFYGTVIESATMGLSPALIDEEGRVVSRFTGLDQG